jgi:hypothetical protein
VVERGHRLPLRSLDRPAGCDADLVDVFLGGIGRELPF